ncbi:MAG: hypothetical protein EZS28_032593 [Streblomastix strix]|uniref:Uncharacterized protein n=1 Tax=Streblomastix strix TaxID=222440 RepID=A0A5J4UPD8_9EUKA|nr:MAG: hypothetical protein EZS28_032593 [Streblomastix strix]
MKNFVVTEVTANMSGCKATDDCLQRVHEFFTNRPFVVPAQRVEPRPFSIIQLNTSNLDLSFEATNEFEDALIAPRNNASRGLNPHTYLTSFKITLQYERSSNGTLISDSLDANNQNKLVVLKGPTIYHVDTNRYYNVDLMVKRQPPPILFTIHDTFWLFGPANGGSCVCDIICTFNQVISQIEG